MEVGLESWLLPHPTRTDIARAGGIVASTFSLPQAAGAAAFAFGVGGMCGLLPGRLLDGVNNVLVGGVVASFLVSSEGPIRSVGSFAEQYTCMV